MVKGRLAFWTLAIFDHVTMIRRHLSLGGLVSCACLFNEPSTFFALGLSLW